MADASVSPQAQPRRGRNKKIKWSWLLGAVLVGTALISAYWWFFMRNRVTTDDAYVKADSATVSTRVPGTITRLLVDNDEFVAKGTVLLELDPADYQAEADKRRAALERTEADVKVSQLTVELTDSLTQARVEMAEAALKSVQDKEKEARHRLDELQQHRAFAEAEFIQTRRDNERYSNLHRSGAGSQQQWDKASTAFKKATAQLEATEAQIAAARASLAATLQDIKRARAELQSALADRLQVHVEKNKLASLIARRAEMQADLQMAQLNVSYCRVAAPIAGYIAQKRIQLGDRVQPGQALLAVVPLQAAYVEANYKETELEHVRLGQPAEVRADIYPGYVYYGKVVGIRAGTGAAFSLLPPENATGNWIKVVQRVPVKIELDPRPPAEYPLRVGLSLVVTISTAERSGPRLIAEQTLTSSAGMLPIESANSSTDQ